MATMNGCWKSKRMHNKQIYRQINGANVQQRALWMRIKCWVIRDFIFGLFLVPTPYSFGAPKAIAYPITMWLYVCVAWTRVIFSTIIANGEFLFFSGFLSFSAECSNILVFFSAVNLPSSKYRVSCSSFFEKEWDRNCNHNKQSQRKKEKIKTKSDT